MLSNSFPRVYWVAAVVAAAAVTLTACSASTVTSAGSSGGASSGLVPGTGLVTQVPAADRKAAPALSGKDLDGRPLALADYRGEIVVINVWGSWCAPCRAEAKGLGEVSRQMQGKGVRFLGINTRDLDTSQALAFERTYDIPYRSLYDPDGTLLLTFPPGSLNPQAIPSTLVIDRQGRIAVRALTPLTQDQLRAAIAPVVAEKP